MELLYLLMRAVENPRELSQARKAISFAAKGFVICPSIAPQSLAVEAVGNLESRDQLMRYPTILNDLRFLAGAEVVPCPDRDAQFVVYVAASAGMGMNTSDVAIVSADSDWEPTEPDPRYADKKEFTGCKMFYRVAM